MWDISGLSVWMRGTYVVPGTEKSTRDLPKWNETWWSMRCLVAMLERRCSESCRWDERNVSDLLFDSFSS